MSIRQAYRKLHRAALVFDPRMILAITKYRPLRGAYYDRFWQNAAAAVDATCEPWRFGFTRISRNGISTVVKEARVMLDDHITLNLMGNKVLTYELMSERGFQVPRHCVFKVDETNKLLDFFSKCDGSVVVKPVGGTGAGRGITTGITSERALKKAARYAARFDDTLLAEEHITGASYRLLYLDGEFIDAIRRDPPRVTGDGKKTIAQLMAQETSDRLNHSPVRALNPLLPDQDSRNCLRDQGLTLSSRPDAEHKVVVKNAVNQNAASENVSVRTDVDKSVIETGARLARMMSVRLAGVDLICNDISVPLDKSGGHFNEVNTCPGLHHHDLISNPSDRAGVGEQVLHYLFEKKIGFANP